MKGLFAGLVLAAALTAPQALAHEQGQEQDGIASDQETPPPVFSIKWSRWSGGGGVATGGAYSVNGTIGQHEARPEPAPSGANFALRGGFWMLLRPSDPAIIDVIFRDRYESN